MTETAASRDLPGQDFLFGDPEDVPATNPGRDLADWEHNWTAVRLPVALKEQFAELLEEIVDHYTKTGRGLPEGANPDRPAMWWALKKALDDYTAHKRRSRARK